MKIPLFPELLSSQTHLAAVSGVSVSTKRSGCPAQSQTCPGLYSDPESEWSSLLFSQQKIYGYPSWCWFQSAKSEAGFSSTSGSSTIIPDIVTVHLQVLYPLLVLPQETTGTLMDKVLLYLTIRVQQTLISPQCLGYSLMLSVTYVRPVCRYDRFFWEMFQEHLDRYRQICT